MKTCKTFTEDELHAAMERMGEAELIQVEIALELSEVYANLQENAEDWAEHCPHQIPQWVADDVARVKIEICRTADGQWGVFLTHATDRLTAWFERTCYNPTSH